MCVLMLVFSDNQWQHQEVSKWYEADESGKEMAKCSDQSKIMINNDHQERNQHECGNMNIGEW